MGRHGARKDKATASTTFEDNFPTLTTTVGKLEEITDYENVKLNLKFASDEELSNGTRSFFTKQMGSVIETIDDELTAVLGDSWTNLKSQSKGMIAVHTILVLWRV